ncbi:MAG: cytochrome c maturation protein CcmE [Caldilineaceae bacterium]
MAQALDSTRVIPADLAQRRSAGGLKFVIGGLLLIAVVIFLMVQATVTTGAYYMTVTEVAREGASLVGERVRVSGQVVAGSEDWQAREMTLRFRIQDEAGAELPIVFFGPRPDNFQRAAEAIAEGTMLADGSFQANDLLLKCPSRYEEQPEEVYVQATR